MSENEKAIEELEKIMQLKSISEASSLTFSKVYQESGIVGVFKELIHYELQMQDVHTNYKLAEYYAFLGEKENAISYLEESYERSERPIIFLKYNPYFKNLKSEPSFKTLLKKMDLED